MGKVKRGRTIEIIANRRKCYNEEDPWEPGLNTPLPELSDNNRDSTRRWVVERTHSWFNRFRKLLIRWEKKVEDWLGLTRFIACLMVYHRAFLG